MTTTTRHRAIPPAPRRQPWDGEYGGINYRAAGHLWDPGTGSAGTYTLVDTPTAIAPLYDTFVDDLVSSKAANGLNGAVYTEITDAEIETNGLLTYDRLLKPDWTAILKSNEKAITGTYTTPTTILPTSQTTGQTWKYTHGERDGEHQLVRHGVQRLLLEERAGGLRHLGHAQRRGADDVENGGHLAAPAVQRWGADSGGPQQPALRLFPRRGLRDLPQRRAGWLRLGVFHRIRID